MIRSNAKLIADGSQQLDRVQPGIEYIGRRCIVIQSFKKISTQCGLAGAYFAGDNDETVPLTNGIGKMCKRNLMVLAQIQIIWIWHQFERLFTQSEIAIVHETSYPQWQLIGI